MNLREAVSKLFVGGVSIAVLEFVAIAGFTQLLGAEAMGSFFLFQALIGLIGVPADLGVTRATEQQLSAGEPTGEVISTAVVVKALLLAPWVVGLLAAGALVNQYIGFEGAVLFTLCGLVTGQGRRLSIRILAGQLLVAKTALLRFIGKVTWVGVGAVLIYVGWNIEAVIFAFIAGDLVVVVGTLVRMEIAIGWPNIQRSHRMVSFGKYVFIGSVGGFVYSWMDVLLLRLFGISTSLIGAYEIAWRIASLSMVLTQAVRNSLFPQISEWYTDNRFRQIGKSLSQWIQPIIFLTLPALAGAVVLGNSILSVVFGISIAVAYPLLLIFMGGKVIRSVQMVLGPSLFAMNQPELGYRGSVVAVGMNLVLNVSLIPFFGVIGAAVATVLSAVAAAAVHLWYVQRFVTISFPWRRIVWCLAASVGMMICVWMVQPYIPTGWLQVGIGVVVGAIIYFLLLLSNSRIRSDLRSFLAEFGIVD
jgi:O-antigen/teichoic acid export membrane protein